MRDILLFIFLLPRGVMMSGPFAIAGTIAGFILGVAVGLTLAILW